MHHWRFMDYVSPAGTNAVHEWCEKLPDSAKVRLDVILQHLQKSISWQKPEFARISGKHFKGLGEIRFHVQNVQYRIIGMNGPGQGVYTLLIGCTHKGRVYDPPSALDTAVERKRLLENRKGAICEH